MEEVEGAGKGVAYGKWEGEVVLGGIVKITSEKAAGEEMEQARRRW